MDLSNFTQSLNEHLQIHQYPDFCPNGLQVEGSRNIRKAATAVSANLQTLQAAAEKGLDALIVHHGIFWNRDPYPVTGSKKTKIGLLLQQGISLLAYHLPLDAHLEVGNNWKAAKDLGWGDLEPFGEVNGLKIGVKGKFSPRPIGQFTAELEDYYQHKAAAALHGKNEVQSAALISGGAYKELANAASEGVDCFITGNFDEPAWGVAYEEKMHFLALGHAATEKIGPRALAAFLRETWNLPCDFLDIENPF